MWYGAFSIMLAECSGILFSTVLSNHSVKVWCFISLWSSPLSLDWNTKETSGTHPSSLPAWRMLSHEPLPEGFLSIYIYNKQNIWDVSCKLTETYFTPPNVPSVTPSFSTQDYSFPSRSLHHVSSRYTIGLCSCLFHYICFRQEWCWSISLHCSW